MIEPFRKPSRDTDATPGPNPRTPIKPEGVSEPSTKRVYTNEEVSEVVRIALSKANHRDANTVEHEELLAIARDFGLTESDISSAFDEIGKSRAVDELKERAALALKVHLMVFAVVNAGLFLINMLSDPAMWWFLYPMVSWGMALLLHAIATKYIPALAVKLEHAFVYSRDRCATHRGAGRDSARAQFSIPNLYGDLAEARGVALIRGNKLLIEFEVVDNVFGAFRSKVREVAIPIDEIASVRLDRSLWATSLHIEGYRMKRFRQLPGSAGGQIKLVFDHTAQEASEHLAHALTERISNR